MSWIKFNNQTSTDFGIMEKVPVIPAAEQQIKTIDIPYGTPVFLNQGYKSIKTENFKLGLKNVDVGHIYKVHAWLQGFGQLQTSKEPNVYFNAVLSSSVVTKDLSKRLSSVEFSFLCEPFRHDIINEVIDVDFTMATTQKNAKIINEGTAEAYAEYEIEAGSGECIIWNNNKYITFNYGSGIYKINTEYCSMMKDGVIIQVNPRLEFLILKPGTNSLTVTNNIKSVKIKKNRRWF